jgi:prepilin-type N-terminal cleavage/methylation domain-containing protein
MKKGFTIVELLMVIAVIAVLLGIVTAAATASIRQARGRRAAAMKQTLQAGIVSYRQLKDEWPGKLEDWAEQSHNGTLGYLSNGDYDKVVQELLKLSAGKSARNRVLDPIGLLVMNATAKDGVSGGMDYRAVATKNHKYAKRMSATEMTVVYPKQEDGKAYRYVIEYNTESDSVTVMTQWDFHLKWGKLNPGANDSWWRGDERWSH